jgi:hypothetical protein
MKALEAASVKGQITPLAEFIVQEMTYSSGVEVSLKSHR